MLRDEDQQAQPPARREHPVQFAQQQRLVIDGAQHAEAPHHVERSGGKGQFGSGLHGRQAEESPGCSARPGLGLTEHRPDPGFLRREAGRAADSRRRSRASDPPR